MTAAAVQQSVSFTEADVASGDNAASRPAYSFTKGDEVIAYWYGDWFRAEVGGVSSYPGGETAVRVIWDDGTFSDLHLGHIKRYSLESDKNNVI